MADLVGDTAEEIDEPRVGGVDVQEARTSTAGLVERVLDARRRSDERSGPSRERLALGGELDLALEDVEAVRVVVVGVDVRALEDAVDVELEHGELGTRRLHDRRAIRAHEPLALARQADDGIGRRPAALRRRVERVERNTPLASVPPRAPRLGEAAVRCVQIEPARARARDLEAMHEAGRHEDERPGRNASGLTGEVEFELALEDVEAVAVPFVDVRRDLLATGKGGLQERERGEGGLDQVLRFLRERLACAGP